MDLTITQDSPQRLFRDSQQTNNHGFDDGFFFFFFFILEIKQKRKTKEKNTIITKERNLYSPKLRKSKINKIIFFEMFYFLFCVILCYFIFLLNKKVLTKFLVELNEIIIFLYDKIIL
jgi:hypothetical protein